jgi:hypothetical protein
MRCTQPGETKGAGIASPAPVVDLLIRIEIGSTAAPFTDEGNFMDVLVKLSLAGGHSWEFVCDQEDALVSGVISAIPGATVDSALPPDGLVQVENRRGERFFFSRSSLVSVMIVPLPTAVALPHEPAFVTPAPFIVVPAIFDQETLVEARVAFGDDPRPADASWIPPRASDAIAAAAYAALRTNGVDPDMPSHLTLRPLRATAGEPVRAERAGAAVVLLDMALVLTGETPLTLSLSDLLGADPLAAAGTGRLITLASNSAIFLPAAPAGAAMDWQIDIPAAGATLLLGQVRRGVSVDGE